MEPAGGEEPFGDEEESGAGALGFRAGLKLGNRRSASMAEGKRVVRWLTKMGFMEGRCLRGRKGCTEGKE